MPQFRSWMTYCGTALSRSDDGHAYTYRLKHVSIDADGAPDAYHPSDQNARDRLANAGYPAGKWKSILVPDPEHPNRPYLQPGGEFEGYFVSATALRSAGADTDPATYVDAARIPYMVFPGAFLELAGTGVMGDFMAVRNLASGATAYGIVADIGPRDAALGEISICMAEQLSGNSVDAATGAGAPKDELLFVVFPRSHATPKWPLSADEIRKHASDCIATLGGWEKIQPVM